MVVAETEYGTGGPPLDELRENRPQRSLHLLIWIELHPPVGAVDVAGGES